MAAGFMHAISPINLLAMLASTIVGIAIGCLPGLSAAMGVALLLPVEGVWELLAYLIPYGAIAWKVIWKAVKNISRGQIFDENFLMCVASLGAMCAGDYK